MTSQVIASARAARQTAGMHTPAPPAMPRLLLILVLVPFSVLSAAALWQHGYWGLFEPALHSLGAAQVLIDLVIALGLLWVWLWRDARARGRNPWPWVVLTLAAGSFGPLLYLLTQPQPGASGSRENTR